MRRSDVPEQLDRAERLDLPGPDLTGEDGALARAILDATPGSTCLLDSRGTIVATNARWRDFSDENDGDQARTGVGANYLAVLGCVGAEHSVAAADWSTQLSGVLVGDLDSFELEYRCDSPLEARWYAARASGIPGFGACISHLDVSEARQAQLTLQHALLHDPGTGLPNRQAIESTIDGLAATVGASGIGVTAVMIELAGMARVRENLGRVAEDDLLADVARRLEEHLPGGSTLGRFSADTFVAVWRAAGDACGSVTTARRLLSSLRQPFGLQGGLIDVSANVGVAFDATPGQDHRALLADAESATRRSRVDGGGGMHVFTTDLRAGGADRWRLEREIRQGLQRDEFALHYQPVVDLRTGRVVGVEALARWQHPDGLRMPDSFIPVAESSGLIVALGAWVLHDACRQGAAWAAAGLDLRVAVNLSAQQVGHRDIVRTIDDALAATGLPGDRLLVEVTESTVLEHSERIAHVLDDIRARGIDIAIDDFGTGYSSLLYLKRYPIQALKVDRQFVSGLGTTTQDDAIVAGVVAFARAVGATSIAEGVETVVQYEVLRALRCRYAQGYLFSRPVPACSVPDAITAAHAVLAGMEDARRLSTGDPHIPLRLLS